MIKFHHYLKNFQIKLNIIFLGPNGIYQKEIVKYLKNHGENVTKHNGILNNEFLKHNQFQFLVSYGYRYIINEQILNRFNGNAINLHISYLPWNKGADPNLWSFLDNTPKGITIHLMEKKLDEGALLCQEKFFFDQHETLKSSYEKLSTGIVELFKKNWDKIKNKQILEKKQNGKGSFHLSKDKEPFLHLLSKGWETKVKGIINKGKNFENR